MMKFEHWENLFYNRRLLLNPVVEVPSHELVIPGVTFPTLSTVQKKEYWI